ncbi:MAG TPA: type II toxin-antitoxin system PemK/MazF family toxin [Pirellulales bacterium]|nr:type II toxin-antitoxin system PemK/MazF family toxin [Pirellulales bacterium]
MHDAGDVVVADFPGAMGVKRRPAVVLSSSTYHTVRPDVIIGLITSQTASAAGPTDYLLLDWAAAGLRLPSGSQPHRNDPSRQTPQQQTAVPTHSRRPRRAGVTRHRILNTPNVWPRDGRDTTKSCHAQKRVTDNDIFDNRLIFGDNLLALRALESEFTGQYGRRRISNTDLNCTSVAPAAKACA